MRSATPRRIASSIADAAYAADAPIQTGVDDAVAQEPGGRAQSSPTIGLQLRGGFICVELSITRVFEFAA
jgi:hypothetical protein